MWHSAPIEEELKGLDLFKSPVTGSYKCDKVEEIEGKNVKIGISNLRLQAFNEDKQNRFAAGMFISH